MEPQTNLNQDKQMVQFLSVVHNVPEQDAVEIYSSYTEHEKQALYVAVFQEKRDSN